MSKVIVAAASVLADTFLSIRKPRASTFPHSFTVRGNTSSPHARRFQKPHLLGLHDGGCHLGALVSTDRNSEMHVKRTQTYSGRKDVSKISPSRVKRRKGPLQETARAPPTSPPSSTPPATLRSRTAAPMVALASGAPRAAPPPRTPCT